MIDLSLFFHKSHIFAMIQITSRYTLSSLYDTYLLHTRNIPNWEQGELKVPQTMCANGYYCVALCI